MEVLLERLARLLGVESGDGRSLLLLSLRAVVVSAATVCGQAYQSALFLEVFDAGMLPWQYAAMAVISIAIASPYARVQRRFGEATADRVLYGLLAAGMLPALLSADLVHARAFLFVYTLWVQLIGFFGNVGLWDAAVRAFPSRKARTYLPIVAASATAGCILGGQITRQIATAAGNDAVAPALIVLAVATALFAGRPRIEDAAPRGRKEPDSGMLRQGALLMRHNRLARYLTLAVLLSMPLFLAVDFAFKRVLQQSYPADRISALLGDYYFYLNAVVIVLQTLVMGRLMSRLGVLVISATTPVVTMVALTTLAIWPTLAAAMALAVVSGAARFTFFQNSRNQLFAPLSPREKSVASMLNRTVVIPAGSVLASLALLPVSSAPVPVLALVSFGCAACLLVFLWLASRAYRDELVASLRQRTLSLHAAVTGLSSPDAGLVEVLRSHVAKPEDQESLFAASLLAQWGLLQEEDLVALSRSPDPAVRVAASGFSASLDPRGGKHFLADLLLQETHPLVLAHACGEAAGAQLPQLAGIASDLAQRTRDPVRVAAGVVLGAAIPAPLPDVLAALSEVPDSGPLAVELAAVVQGPVGLRFLAAALSRGDPASRNAALDAVSRRHVQELYPDVETCLVGPGRLFALRAVTAAGLTDTLVLRHTLDMPDCRLASCLLQSAARHARPETLARVLELGSFHQKRILLRSLERCPRSQLPPLPPGLTESLGRELVTLALAAASATTPAARSELDVQRRIATRSVFAALRLRLPDQARLLADLEQSLGLGDARRDNAALELLEPVGRTVAPWFPLALETSRDKLLQAASLAGLQVAAGADAPALLAHTSDRLVTAVVACLEGKEAPMPDVHVDPERIRKASLLRQSGFFGKLPTELLVEVAGRGHVVHLMAGETLFREGDKPDALYVVLQGSLAVTQRGDRLSTLGPGAPIGEIALLDHGVRSATVAAESRAELLRFDPDLFQEILDDYPEVSQGVISTLVQHIRELSRQ